MWHSPTVHCLLSVVWKQANGCCPPNGQTSADLIEIGDETAPAKSLKPHTSHTNVWRSGGWIRCMCMCSVLPKWCESFWWSHRLSSSLISMRAPMVCVRVCVCVNKKWVRFYRITTLTKNRSEICGFILPPYDNWSMETDTFRRFRQLHLPHILFVRWAFFPPFDSIRSISSQHIGAGVISTVHTSTNKWNPLAPRKYRSMSSAYQTYPIKNIKSLSSHLTRATHRIHCVDWIWNFGSIHIGFESVKQITPAVAACADSWLPLIWHSWRLSSTSSQNIGLRLAATHVKLREFHWFPSCQKIPACQHTRFDRRILTGWELLTGWESIPEAALL